MVLLHDMLMGANGRRNDGWIRPAEWWRNGSKNAAAPPKTRSHQPNTACRHWETYITRKNINNLHKINLCYEKKLNFVEKICIWLAAQHTMLNTTNNTQHKIHSCYIISFETYFAFDCWHNTVLWYTTNNTQHNKQCTTQNT